MSPVGEEGEDKVSKIASNQKKKRSLMDSAPHGTGRGHLRHHIQFPDLEKSFSLEK